MSEHRATVEWQRSGEFRYETYSRTHELRFDGVVVPGNASAANSSCHMLWFLHSAHENCYIANSVKTEVVIEPC